jgi:uncharacterized protein (TIRG00374 family)
MNRFGHIAISLLLTAIVGYLIYRGVPDWAEAWAVMMRGRPLYLLAGFAFSMLHMVLRAARWGVLLVPLKARISYQNLFSLTLVKYVINVIPPRAGEIVASIVLARKEKIPSASVIASSILERVLDVLAVIFLFGCYLLLFGGRYLPQSEQGEAVFLTIRRYSMIGFVVLSLGFVILALLLRRRSWIEWLPARVRRLVSSFMDGFHALRSRGALVKVALYSLIIWLTITTQIWFLLKAYLPQFPYPGTLLILAMTVVGVAIPTPGGVGGYQFFMNLVLVHFFSQHLSPLDPHSQAAGISNGCYIVSMVPVLLIGLVFLNREGLSLSRISEIKVEGNSTER